MQSENSQMHKIMCEASDCSYNRDETCHADSITIGDHGRPLCDTFCLSPVLGGYSGTHASVGACKVENCLHNHGLLCHCNYITIGHKDDDFYCMTYTERSSVLQI